MGAVKVDTKERLSPRVAVQGHARYRLLPINDQGPRNAVVQNVSLGGFKFRSDEFLNRKSNLLLEMYLPGSCHIRSLATVAWVKALIGDDGYEMGGMFVEPSHEARMKLLKIVFEH